MAYYFIALNVKYICGGIIIYYGWYNFQNAFYLSDISYTTIDKHITTSCRTVTFTDVTALDVIY